MATIGLINPLGLALFKYGIGLKEAGAGAGDFLAAVEGDDIGPSV
jgi:hypothetical protein